MCFVCFCLQAQPIVWVNDTQMVLLCYPSEIKYVDFGNGNLRGKLLGVPGMLQLQSESPFNAPTTVSLVTADGQFHSCQVAYADSLPCLAYQNDAPWQIGEKASFSNDQTVHFLCNEPVVEIVCGSDMVLAGCAESTNNLIRAKAAEKLFPTSSLTLVTASAKVYPFRIYPSAQPNRLLWNLGEISTADEAPVRFAGADVSDTYLLKQAKSILARAPRWNSLGVAQHEMQFALTDIITVDDVLAFRMFVANKSGIDYAVDFFKVYIQDHKTNKSVAVQEDELQPLLVYASKQTLNQPIEAGDSRELVCFLPRFTLPENRNLIFELFERNGGRHLRFEVGAQRLLQARKRRVER